MRVNLCLVLLVGGVLLLQGVESLDDCTTRLYLQGKEDTFDEIIPGKMGSCRKATLQFENYWSAIFYSFGIRLPPFPCPDGVNSVHLWADGRQEVG